jgi:mono/diheme cytochrome c family protein
MLKNRAVVSGQWSAVSQPARLFGGLLIAACCLLGVACRRDMQDQPKYKPYRQADFFNDKLSTRPAVAGTVSRGHLQDDAHLYTGKQEGGPAPGPGNEFAGYEDKFPFPVTEEVLHRGQERFAIFCSACHGPLGDGNGMIARRGFAGIKTYHDDRLRNAPVGYIFDVITNGFGKMPAYNHQIPVKDRWAIVTYVKALQASQPGTVPSTTTQNAPAQPAASPAVSPPRNASTPAGGHN